MDFIVVEHKKLHTRWEEWPGPYLINILAQFKSLFSFCTIECPSGCSLSHLGCLCCGFILCSWNNDSWFSNMTFASCICLIFFFFFSIFVARTIPQEVPELGFLALINACFSSNINYTRLSCIFCWSGAVYSVYISILQILETIRFV